MKVFRRVSDYFYEIVFNAPKSHFVVLNVFYLVSVGIYALFFFEDNGEIFAGLEFLAFFIFLLVLDIALFFLLVWRRFARGTYKSIMKSLSSTIIVLLLLLPIFYGALNYKFDIQHNQLKNDALNNAVETAFIMFITPFAIIAPLAVIKEVDYRYFKNKN